MSDQTGVQPLERSIAEIPEKGIAHMYRIFPVVLQTNTDDGGGLVYVYSVLQRSTIAATWIAVVSM